MDQFMVIGDQEPFMVVPDATGRSGLEGRLTSAAAAILPRAPCPKPARPQPIRDSIIAFLSGPRSVGEIAEHIDRPVPTTTGHLAAMRRLGLVKRLAYATYAPDSYDGPLVRFTPRRTIAPLPLRKALVAALAQRSTVMGLHLKTGASPDLVRSALRDMWLTGSVIGDERSGFELSRYRRERDCVL